MPHGQHRASRLEPEGEPKTMAEARRQMELARSDTDSTDRYRQTLAEHVAPPRAPGEYGAIVTD